VHARGDVVAASALDIRPGDVLDGQALAVAVLARVGAGGDVYGLVDVVDLEIAESDVTHAALPWVYLDPGRVGRVDAPEVLKHHVVDCIWPIAVTQRPGHDATGLVARHVLDIDVVSVGFN